MALLRPVLGTVGILVAILGLSMLAPAFVDWLAGSGEWRTFLLAAALTLFCGLGVVIAFREAHDARGVPALSVQQTFLITVGSWFALPLFAMAPFLFGATQASLADAFFESMSGLTTTGATVLRDLESLPQGVILWRAMLQWFGGIGIIVVAMAFLPAMRVGGMQFFRVEGMDSISTILPRALAMIRSISLIYGGFTVLFAFLYTLCGMAPFDAILHAMTSIASGGFSSRSNSFADFPPAVHYAAVIFMLISALPFARYVQLLAGSAAPLFRDSQVRAFLGVALGVFLAIAAYRIAHGAAPSERMFREVAFNGVSILTGTGYAMSNYGLWGAFPSIVFLAIGLIGGCAGSSCCGIKVFRFQVLLAMARVQFRKLRTPYAVFQPFYQGKVITGEIASAVAGFMFLFMATLVVLAVALSAIGLDAVTAVSGAAMALGNIGIGLGSEIGPAGNFGGLPDSAKWLLATGMFLGRLELLSVFVLFSPRFWRG